MLPLVSSFPVAMERSYIRAAAALYSMHLPTTMRLESQFLGFRVHSSPRIQVHRQSNAISCDTSRIYGKPVHKIQGPQAAGHKLASIDDVLNAQSVTGTIELSI